MTASLRALLANVIDYAGLFPPASLPLAAALDEYKTGCSAAHAWMIGAFVIPVGRLPELDPWMRQREATCAQTVSVIGRGGDDERTWLAALQEDLATTAEFVNKHGPHVAITGLEVRLPTGGHGLGPRNEELSQLLAPAADHIRASCLSGLTLFLEVPRMEAADALRRRLAELAAGVSVDDVSIGVKLRTGSPDGMTVPSIASVASLIDACARAGTRWKATAGLHHCLRSSRGAAPRHGFLNLVTAAVLARACELGKRDVHEILSDGTAASFEFGPDGVGWRDVFARVAEIELVRRDGFVSFGSCSMTEPWNDLRGLGLLESSPVV